ncbi:MAG: AraC family transcriptional regulator [Pseudobutyrivibrio sp.]|nr:AraC family transcriptional regulator [Pseudobutyrivibrio sp.]
MEINENYFMSRQSRRLHTVIRKYDTKNHSVTRVCLRQDLSDDEIYTTSRFHQLISNAASDIPEIYAINQLFIYAFINTNGNIYIVGPIKFDSNYSIKNELNIKIDNNIANSLANILPAIKWENFVESLLDFANIFKKSNDEDHEIIEKDLVTINCIEKNFNYKLRQDLENKIFEEQENGRHHNPYDQEVRELSAIENGDEEALKRSLAEDYTGQVGVLAKDNLRNNKNVALVVIATSSRAAIKGGLSPEIAFSMADLYSLQIEEATTDNIPLQITRNAEFEYTRIVHQIKTERAAMNSFSGEENEHVMSAKNYIFKHLHGKITVAEIAEELGLNANYLSEIFSKSENVTLKDYIINNKIYLVKNLLTYSAYSYTEIAYYLGFSSQSHLGKQFKKKTGMTLSQYRQKYQLQEYLD